MTDILKIYMVFLDLGIFFFTDNCLEKGFIVTQENDAKHAEEIIMKIMNLEHLAFSLNLN